MHGTHIRERSVSICLSTLCANQKTSKKGQTTKFLSSVDDLNDYTDEIIRFEESRRKSFDDDDRGNNQLATSREELLAYSKVCSDMLHSISSASIRR